MLWGDFKDRGVFEMSTQLIRKNLNEADLPKKARTILRKCDKLITYYLGQSNEVKRVVLFDKDRRYLTDQLHETGQDINEVAYRGFTLQ